MTNVVRKFTKIGFVTLSVLSILAVRNPVDPNKFNEYKALTMLITDFVTQGKILLPDGDEIRICVEEFNRLIEQTTENPINFWRDSFIYMFEAFKLNPSLTASTDPAKNPDLLYSVEEGIVSFILSLGTYSILPSLLRFDTRQDLLSFLQSREPI